MLHPPHNRHLVRLLASGLWVVLLWLCLTLSSWAQPVFDRTPLTMEALQQRTQTLTHSEGFPTIDLRRLVIDLRSENAAFRDQFYHLVQAQLQQPGQPVALDLSYSVILGDFQFKQLGLRAPLYGEALSPIFTPAEQEQLQRDRRRLVRLSTLSQTLLATPNLGSPLQITVFRGPLRLTQTRFEGLADFDNTFFLERVEAQGVKFVQDTDWTQTRFSQLASFGGSVFGRDVRFRSSIFFGKAAFDRVQFNGKTNFQSSEFQLTANFNSATFQQLANFTRVQWRGNADFAQTHWFSEALFTRGRFQQAAFFPAAIFEKLAQFREVQFGRPVNLRGAVILERADFGNTSFAKGAYLNVPGLEFDPDRAKIVGNPGQIGRSLAVPTLQGNENLLRSLVRNFRRIEQIPDANQLEYTRERLHLRELGQQGMGVNINTAPTYKLKRLGLSSSQVGEIVRRREQTPFRSPTELLALNAVDLATYINIRDRVIAKDGLPGSLEALSRLATGVSWLGLSLLLVLSRYGTDFWLVFGVGLVSVGYFGVLFWLVDRWRRIVPTSILPSLAESVCVFGMFTTLAIWGVGAIFRASDTPWLTLLYLGIIVIPVPVGLLGALYWQGRYHALMDVSYFMEEGTLRQLRIVIGRLPIIPRYEDYRKRYLPILLDRRWTWLNYFDFSLNNLLKLGFNDIRLRDEELPGLITALVWYQWSLGVLYIALLLWTLSRTIPGLNLLIYFR